MKKHIFYMAMAALSLTAFPSCEDTLTETPDSSYDKESFFTSEANADMAVMGIYNSISDYRHYGWYEMAAHASDDMFYTSRTHSDNTVHDMAHYRVTSTNEWVEWLWLLKYQGIDRANLAIDGIVNMPDYAGSKNLQELDAECRFLRAFLAFDLVKYWGDVPFKTNYTSNYEEAYGPRVDREEIYDQIIADLDFAKEHLEWATAGSSPERATQGAARALLMRIYLQRAGYSLQMDGQLTRPDETKRAEYFNAAIAEWEAIEANGYHGFCDEGYEQLFKNSNNCSRTSLRMCSTRKKASSKSPSSTSKAHATAVRGASTMVRL